MKVLVVGDSCEDVFDYGKCTRLCPDAPVPVFIPNDSKNNTWDYLKDNNRFNLIGNNDYLFGENYLFNPKNMLKNNPIINFLILMVF